MPADDAGLEQAARAYPVEAEEALDAWMDLNARAGIWVSPAGWWYAAWMHRQPEVERLQAQLVAVQAQLVARGPYCALHGEHQPCSQHRWIDAAQAAQPEGERVD